MIQLPVRVLLLAGVPVTAPQAEQATVPVAPPPPAIELRDAAGNPLPPEVQQQLRDQLKTAPPTRPVTELRDADGKPLPAEVQKQLREQIETMPPPRPAGEGQDVVVTGRKPRGGVIGDIPPERTLSALDIRSYGANSVSELIQALGQQVSSGRGRDDGGPVVLLNGRRVSSFAEIANLPTEAIERMEILPEEVALKYGYRADQKVVNVVAFETFTSRIGQLTGAIPTEGGQTTTGASGGYFRIRGDTRFTLDADASRSSALLESERDVRQVADDPVLGEFRTLLPATERYAVNGTIAGTPLNGVSATLNGRFDSTSTRGLVGLGTDGALRRDGNTQGAHIGTTLGGRAGRWLWTITGNLDRTTSDTATDTGIAAAPRNDGRFVNTVATADVLLTGTLFDLPAGAVSTSVHGGGATRDFTSRSRLGDVTQTTDLARDLATVQANLDIPIARRDANALSWIGTLSASANVEVERMSDFGTLTTFGYGLNWSPIAAITLLASVTEEEKAPTVEQLGAPLIVAPNQRIFDFSRRETVDVTRILGGNRALRADDRHVFSLGLTAKPFANTDLMLNVDYIATRVDDPIAAFPIATAPLEAAFPERFTRDALGQLQRIDATPINFARSEQQQVRWGISFQKPLGALPPGVQNAQVRVFSSEAEAKRRMPPGAVMMRAEAGSPAARRLENLTSRLTFSLQHNWRLQDDVLLRAGTPVLDLLDGGALDSRGGRPRHEVEVQAGVFKRGLGARITANWQSGTSILGLGGTAGDLTFSDLATVNVSLFANVADYLGKAKTPTWLNGTRVTLGITNLFNARQDVRDGAGATPIGYQPAYLNPIGRLLALSVRKRF